MMIRNYIPIHLLEITFPESEKQAKLLGAFYYRVNMLLAKYPGKLNPMPVIIETGTPNTVVKIRDLGNAIDQWLDNHPEFLVECNLWRKSPEQTQGWCELTIDKKHDRTFNV